VQSCYQILRAATTSLRPLPKYSLMVKHRLGSKLSFQPKNKTALEGDPTLAFAVKSVLSSCEGALRWKMNFLCNTFFCINPQFFVAFASSPANVAKNKPLLHGEASMPVFQGPSPPRSQKSFASRSAIRPRTHTHSRPLGIASDEAHKGHPLWNASAVCT